MYICITYKYVHIQNIIQYTRAQRQKKISIIYIYLFLSSIIPFLCFSAKFPYLVDICEQIFDTILIHSYFLLLLRLRIHCFVSFLSMSAEMRI